MTKSFREFLWMVNQPGLQDNPEMELSIRVADAIGSKIGDKFHRLKFFSMVVRDMLDGRSVRYMPDDLMSVLHRMPITTYGGDSTKLWEVLVQI
jgi:hypothetical protein